jgi:hypothetical protein
MVVVRFAVATLLLAACGTPPASPQAPPPSSPAASPTATPAAASPTSAASRDITKPCSMISAEEVGAIVGFPVTATDEQFRCKFTDARAGWLSVSLMEASLTSAKEICEYAPSKRTVVSGVGDSASYFGSTVCVKVGDVAIIVDGASVAEHSEQMRNSGENNVFVLVGKTIAGRIP